MPTVCFRGGCLTGPEPRRRELHGFLSYLMRCTITGEPYTVFGYGGKQVRDNIHSADLVRAFEAFHARPRPAAVYNLGGGRESNCSMLEAIELCEQIAGRELEWALSDEPRSATTAGGSATWATFKRDYPGLEARVRDRGHPARDPRRERGALDGGGMKLSVVIPAHNEAASIGATIDGLVDRTAPARGIDYEIVVIDDGSHGRTPTRVVQQSARENPRVRCASARTIPAASGTPSARGWTPSRATRSRS